MKFFSKQRFSKAWFIGLVLGVASSAALVYAAAVNIPNMFTSGQPIIAQQMNANFAALENCPGNDVNDAMVRVGALCVDKYEASVWDNSAGPPAGMQRPDGAYGCNANGNNCTAIFARSELGVIPSSQITWFQAQQACANSNKRLLTDAEWQMAAAGTPDVADDDTFECKTSNAAGAKVNTGSRSRCESRHGVFDMVGNVWEWTADWVQGDNSGAWGPTTGTGTTTAAFGSDRMQGVNPASQFGTGQNFPGAFMGGGNFNEGTASGVFARRADIPPDATRNSVGFRCARAH